MDSLYDNLDNYEDVNIIQDLKNENKELKMKLEQYSTSLNELQIDFDKISSEYKTLQMNYSSLLKTARAEIERKTSMITQLNVEKDMLVIKSFQTNGKRVFNNNPHKVNSKPDGSSIKCEDQSLKKNDIVPGEAICNRDLLVKKQGNKDGTKEHVDSRQDKKQQNIMNHRKSRSPARSPKFSSEEDNEKHHLIREKRRDIRSNITSDTSNVDDKHSNHNAAFKDSSNRSSRYSSCYDDRHRSRDKSRYRMYTSSERNTRNYFSENNNQQNRMSRSPPSDRYSQNKRRIRHSYYNTKYSHNNEIPSGHRDDKHVVKHKLKPHYEEPSHKKIKMDSYGQYGNPEKEFSDGESISPSYTLTSPEDPFKSCQSPDQVNAVGDKDQSLVKEIIQVAATPLEDPRITSKKYFLQNEHGKMILKNTSSVNHVYMKLVDKSHWQIPSMAVPEALLQKPPSVHNIENLCSEIYSNIDNYIDNHLDMSFESPNSNLDPTEQCITMTTTEKFEEEHWESKNLDHCAEKSQSVTVYLNQTSVINTTENDKAEHEECLKDNDIPKESTLDGYQKEQLGSHLPHIISHDAQVLQDVTVLESSPKIHEYQILTTMETVEGDLLLSDDASENMDLQKQAISDRKQEENTSIKIKIKHNPTNKTILADRSSHCQANDKSSSENIKNKGSPIDNISLEIREEPNDKSRTNKENPVDEKSVENKEKPCSKSRSYEYISVDDGLCKLMDKHSNENITKNNTADKISYDIKDNQTVDSKTEQNILVDTVVYPKNVKFGKCEEKDQNSNKYTEELELLHECKEKRSNGTSCTKVGLGNVISWEIKDNPSTDSTKGSLSDENSFAKKDKHNSNSEIDKCIPEIKFLCERRGEAGGVDNEKINSGSVEMPSRTIRKSKVSKDPVVDISYEESDDRIRGGSVFKSSPEEIIECQVKDKYIHPNKTNDNLHVIRLQYEAKDSHRSDIKGCPNAKKLESSKIEHQNQVIRKNVEANKASVSANKKHQARKKSPETKFKEQNKDIISKKSKSRKGKETKIPETKSKFSELFGDSNSLIMPEDLGIASQETALQPSNEFASILEDTQSAVDLSVESVGKTEMLTENLDKLTNTDTLDVRNCLEIVNKTLTKLDDSKHVSENKSISCKNIENSYKTNLYENLNPAVSMDGSNVIILSMGVQSNRVEDGTTKDDINKLIDNLDPKADPKLTLNALATSTPLKMDVELTKFNAVQKNAQLQESRNMVATNSAEQLCEPDVPDVRIFVKRRRKIKKP